MSSRRPHPSPARRYGRAGLVLALMLVGLAAQAQPRDDPGEIRRLRLGLKADAMSIDGWGDFACGNNGGPPRQRLDDWSGFSKCRPEESGLREVYVRFDDADEYIGKATDNPYYAERRIGTRVAGHPVILSVLFDEAGVLRGIRFVTDPRAELPARRMAHLLRRAIFDRYGPTGWSCTEFPPAPGETPVGSIFVKQRCEKATAERHLTVEARMLRKPGQSEIDATGDYTQGQFESWTRFELIDPAHKR